MMDEVYTWVRVLNFTWAFILFLGMIYFGVQDKILKSNLTRRRIEREFEIWILAVFCADVAVILSLAEIFLKNVTGGWRVFAIWPFLVLATMGLRYGAHRVRSKRKSIQTGNNHQ